MLRNTATIMCFLLLLCDYSISYGADKIALPKPTFSGKVSVEAAIKAKKSERNFKPDALTLAQISQMLWAANGKLPVDAVSGATTKVIPSAGGIYPLEVFVLVGKNTVGNLAEGLYYYDPQTDSLQLILPGDHRTLLSHASHGQTWMARAPAIIIISAVYPRIMARYQQRGIQYAHMEAGSADQNLYLQAASLGLKIGTVGAFDDTQVSAVLKLPASTTPLLLVPVGK